MLFVLLVVLFVIIITSIVYIIIIIIYIWIKSHETQNVKMWITIKPWKPYIKLYSVSKRLSRNMYN